VVILSVIVREDAPNPADASVWLTKPVDEDALFSALATAVDKTTDGATVLIVEDDRDLAHILRAMFDRNGLRTVHASTGREALELCRRHTPDVIVLDLGLPDIDGYAVVDALRSDSDLRTAVLVVYTADDLSGIDQDRLRLGETAFFTKSRVPPRPSSDTWSSCSTA
jgi:CheY-like chemotaxis protein